MLRLLDSEWTWTTNTKRLESKKVVPVVRLAIRPGMTRLKITLWIKFSINNIHYLINIVKYFENYFIFLLTAALKLIIFFRYEHDAENTDFTC